MTNFDNWINNWSLWTPGSNNCWVKWTSDCQISQVDNLEIIFCFKCCYRVRELPDNKTTLYVENDAFDNLSVSIEPYSQPVIRPRASLKNTYSYS